jgi:hypothetical protein
MRRFRLRDLAWRRTLTVERRGRRIQTAGAGRNAPDVLSEWVDLDFERAYPAARRAPVDWRRVAG